MFIVLYHPLQHSHILQAEVHLCLRLPKQPQASVCVSVLVDTEGLCSPCRVLTCGPVILFVAVSQPALCTCHMRFRQLCPPIWKIILDAH